MRPMTCEGGIMTRQILLSFEDPWYVVKDIDTGVVSQGETVEEARSNLKEALELFFEDEPEGITTLKGILEQADIKLDDFMNSVR